MGGNTLANSSRKGKAKVSVSTSICLHCKMETHQADSCPFIYSACKRENCVGIRKIKTSHTKANPSRKFLICQFSKCRSFQWLDEAIIELEMTNQIPKQHVIEGCFECGDNEHWESDCPWTKQKCKNGCPGVKKLGISQKKASDGWKYLKCSVCNDFQWLVEAINEADPTLVYEDDLCVSLAGLCTYPHLHYPDKS